MYKNILIPTDGSEISDRALEAGVLLAKTLKAKITGLHVTPSTLPIFYGEISWIDPRALGQLREAANVRAKDYLDRVAARAKSAGVDYECLTSESDQVWKAVIDAAQAKRCDLILMAAHGRRGIEALVLGSETTKVLTHSKIPVLVYR